MNKISNWIIILITAIGIYVVFNVSYWKTDRVISWDIITYYGYLPATFIYNDVTLEFLDKNPGDRNYIFWYSVSPTGGKYSKMSMGLAFLYAPFFFLGHLGAHLFNYHTGGFSLPYKMALVFSCIFYMWLGLFFLRKALKQYYSEVITGLVLIMIVFGTNYFNYATLDAPMSHTYSFALFSLFILLVFKWYKKPSLINSIYIGLLSGLISLIRPTNIIIIILFVFYGILSKNDLIGRAKLYLSKFFFIIVIIVFAIIVWVPQMLYWKAVTGSFLFYSYADEGFFFNNPQIFRGLFSYRNGWLIYSPIMAFALIGIPFLYRSVREIFIPVLLFILVNIYIVLSWWCWWYTGFGNRAMIDSYAVLAFPLAAFINWTAQQKKIIFKVTIFTLMTFAFFQGAFHTIQYHYSTVHYNSMTKGSYWETFWKVRPTDAYWKKLRTPDYDLAKIGITAYLDERNDSLRIYCNVEERFSDGKSLTDSTHAFKLSCVDSLSTEYAYSGRTSIYVNKNNPNGLCLQFRVCINDKFRVTVWRKKTEARSYLIVTNSQFSDYYIAENKAIQTIGDWEKIQMEIEIPPKIHDTILKIYVLNDNEEKVYFDDLRVERIY